MKFETQTHLASPADVAVDTMLNRLEELVPFMPNVAEIRTERHEAAEDGRVDVVRWWMGTAKSVPKLVRPFVTKKSLWWRDYTDWYPLDRRCTWRTESKHSHYCDVAGETVFEPHPDFPGHCILTMRGEIQINGDLLPGVPAFIGRKLAPRIEWLVLSFMRPNFELTGEGLQALIDSRNGAQG